MMEQGGPSEEMSLRTGAGQPGVQQGNRSLVQGWWQEGGDEFSSLLNKAEPCVESCANLYQ